MLCTIYIDVLFTISLTFVFCLKTYVKVLPLLVCSIILHVTLYQVQGYLLVLFYLLKLVVIYIQQR